MTATPSSPMTNPVFAPADVFDFGLEIAAQTFGPTCFSVNGSSAALCAPVTLDTRHTHSPSARARNRRRFIVSSFQSLSWFDASTWYRCIIRRRAPEIGPYDRDHVAVRGQAGT